MDVGVINPFIQASRSTVNMMTQENLGLGKPFLKSNPYSEDDVFVVVGITGALKGQVSFSMKKETACFIASKMIMMPIDKLDDMSKSAVMEIGNMISGNAATLFSTDERSIDITPPSLYIGDNVEVFVGKSQTICVPMFFDDGGAFNLNITVNR